MSAHKSDRNEPCPCGSGRKYKHCCGNPTSGAPVSGMTAAADSLRAAMDKQAFASQAEVKAFAEAHVQQANATGLNDFDGLSPVQMSDLLDAPLDSPHRIEFAQSGVPATDAPTMILFNALADAIGEQGLRTTAKGNLPRAFCQSTQRLYPGIVANDPFADSWTIYREDDFPDLHITRLLAQFAGLIRKYKGRFLLTRKARRLRDRDGIYPVLLATHATRFNWASSDGFAELDLIQQAFAFTLYLLHRHGDTDHSQHFYENAFMRAFPWLLDELPPEPYMDSKRHLRLCYTLRSLRRFAGFLGLIRLTATHNDSVNPEYRIVKTPLLDAAVRFHRD